MNPQFLKTFYTRSVKLLIFIIPFLSLYISSSMFFPYITGRNFGFRILVEIALVLWLGLILLNKEYRPKSSILSWSVLAFVAVVGLATIFSANPYYSFWSRFERMEGYIMILHLAAYFFIATSVLRTRKDWAVLFNIFIIVGLLVGLYALSQRLGFSRAIQGGRARVDGTIGNPTYLASYLLFILALCAVFFSRAREKFAKYYYGIAAVFTLLIIYFTASRGPILALLLAVFLWLVLCVIFVKPRKKIAVGALAVMIVLPILFFALRNTSLIQTKEPTALSRLASISLTEKTTKSRFLIWNMAWKGFKERPILGWGQENYVEVFNKYYEPKLFDQEPWFDRAHNMVFDWLVNAGALGLLSYLSIFAAAFVLLWSLFKRGVLAFGEAGVFFAVLVGHFLQNMLVFDNFNTYIVFFSFIAYVNGLNNMKSVPVSIKRESNANRRAVNLSVIGAAAALIVVVPVMYFVNIKPIKASRSLLGALQMVANQTAPDQVMEKFKGLLADKTFGNLEIREQVAQLAIQLTDSSSMPPESKTNFIKFAIEELENRLVSRPDDLKATLMLGTLYNRNANLDDTYLDKARKIADASIALSPTRQTPYLLLADNYLARNDFNGALLAIDKAVELEPTFTEGQFNLARIAIFAQRDDIAQVVIENVKKLSIDNVADVLAKIGDVYIQVQHFEKAMEVYEDVVKINPQNAQYHANLAGVYLNRGRKADAEREAKLAAELDPANFAEQVEQFLENL